MTPTERELLTALAEDSHWNRATFMDFGPHLSPREREDLVNDLVRHGYVVITLGAWEGEPLAMTGIVITDAGRAARLNAPDTAWP